MNSECEDMIEYMEYKANGYAEQIKNVESNVLKNIYSTKEDVLRELISDIKNGEYLDF